jgi:hypothetical protein
MRSRLLLNVGLTVLLGCLLLLAIYQPGRKEPPKPQRLISLDAGKIGRITIDRVGQDRIEFVRDQDHWRLQKPLAVRANDIKVRALLRFLDTRTDQALAAKDLELKNFGLAEPQVTVSFDAEQFALGDANPVTAKRYILYQDHVYASTDTIYHDLLGEAASFASLSLLPEVSEPTRIVLPHYSLQRDGAKWSITPTVPGLTGDAVIGLVDAWRRAQAVAVKAGAAGPDSKSERVRLEFGNSAPAVEFVIHAREPELVLERPDLRLEYHLFADSGGRLLQPQLAPTPVPASTTAGSPKATAVPSP